MMLLFRMLTLLMVLAFVTILGLRFEEDDHSTRGEPVSEPPSGKYAHFKGFQFMNKEKLLEAIEAGLAKNISGLLSESNISHLAFDGDNYPVANKDNAEWVDYVYVIPEIKKEYKSIYGKDLQVVGFRSTTEEWEESAPTWEDAPDVVVIWVIPPPTLPAWKATEAVGLKSWQQLGVVALTMTKAETVISIGGGGTPKEEMKAWPKMPANGFDVQKVKWHVYQATRKSDEKSALTTEEVPIDQDLVKLEIEDVLDCCSDPQP